MRSNEENNIIEKMLHHYFHPNQIYLTLETLLKTRKRLQDVELPRGSYPNFPEFVDTTVFNRKSNNSLTIAWELNSVNTVINRTEIKRSLNQTGEIDCYKDLLVYFTAYLKSQRDIKVADFEKLPLSLTLSNSKESSGKLQKILDDYIKLFAEDELFGTGKDISFSAHIEIFREYLSKVRVFNPKYLLISPNDLTGLLQEKYSVVNEYKADYKFIEMVTVLWLAEIIDIYYLEIDYKNNKYNYSVTLALKNINYLSVDFIKEKLKLPSISKSLYTLPIDRQYIYENQRLIFKLTDGSSDQLDFSKAKIMRKMFEAFYELWKKDSKGEYNVGEISKSYKRVNNKELDTSTEIGEIVSNIRSTIIYPKYHIRELIEWKYNRARGLWIFRIKSNATN